MNSDDMRRYCSILQPPQVPSISPCHVHQDISKETRATMKRKKLRVGDKREEMWNINTGKKRNSKARKRMRRRKRGECIVVCH